MIEFWVLSAIATAVLTIGLIRDLGSTRVERGVTRWSERFGLAVTDDVRSFLLRRRRWTSLGYDLGLWVGMETGFLATARFDERWSFVGNLAIQAGWWLTGGIGAVLGAGLGARLSPLSGPRVARARAVTLADYVDPQERALPPVAAVLALAVGLAPIAEGASASTVATCAAAGIGGVLLVVVSEVAARAAVRRRQPASIPHVLAWSDALRSETARNALIAGSGIAIATLVLSLPATLAAAGQGVRSTDVRMWTTFGLLALAAAFGIRSMVTRPARYFLRRLWPATAAELAEHERPLEGVPS